jgi:hypothetical protein
MGKVKYSNENEWPAMVGELIEKFQVSHSNMA